MQALMIEESTALTTDAPVNEFGFICGPSSTLPPVEAVAAALVFLVPMAFMVAWLVALVGERSGAVDDA